MTEDELAVLEMAGQAKADMYHFNAECSCAGHCSVIKIEAFTYETTDGVKHVLDDWDIDFLMGVGNVRWWLSPWVRIKMAWDVLWKGYTAFKPISLETAELQRLANWVGTVKKIESGETING
jgi:hypothetical protein